MENTEEFPGEFIAGNPTMMDFGGFISILTQGIRQSQMENANTRVRIIPGPIQLGADARSNEVRDRMLEALLTQLQSLDTGFQHFQQNSGDYALGNTFDQIITRLMEMHEAENKPPAASDDTVNALPRLKFSDNEEHKECPVCQDDYQIDEELVRLPCKHIFHPNCIINWLKLNGTCPVCRFSLVENKSPTQPTQPEPSSNTPNHMRYPSVD
ncbi:hypothetical protein HDV06_000309 [Boothiomyces sp. JEL0866]|nr:hypothetical protein HDV06_000309 [Boothiomyces sp. JEL0866]